MNPTEVPIRSPQIEHALQKVYRTEGAICFSCLEVDIIDEDGLLAAFRSRVPPTHRVVTGRCLLCRRSTRVIRKVQSGTPMPKRRYRDRRPFEGL